MNFVWPSAAKNYFLQHEDGVDQEMRSFQHIGQSIAALFQCPEWCRSGEAAFDHAALAQQREVILRLSQSDQLQLDAIGLGVLLRLFSLVALMA